MNQPTASRVFGSAQEAEGANCWMLLILSTVFTPTPNPCAVLLNAKYAQQINR